MVTPRSLGPKDGILPAKSGHRKTNAAQAAHDGETSACCGVAPRDSLPAEGGPGRESGPDTKVSWTFFRAGPKVMAQQQPLRRESEWMSCGAQREHREREPAADRGCG